LPQFLLTPDLKESVGCGVWGVGKETSFICGGENFFIGTDDRRPTTGDRLLTPQLTLLLSNYLSLQSG